MNKFTSAELTTAISEAQQEGHEAERLGDIARELFDAAASPVEQAEAAPVEQTQSPEETNEPSTTETFAQRVLTVAKDLETLPFRGQVAIDQVYDAYGRVYADAGSLDDFKRRVLQDAKDEKLDLTRANLLAQLPDAARSEIRWGRDKVHLIVVEWI